MDPFKRLGLAAVKVIEASSAFEEVPTTFEYEGVTYTLTPKDDGKYSPVYSIFNKDNYLGDIGYMPDSSIFLRDSRGERRITRGVQDGGYRKRRSRRRPTRRRPTRRRANKRRSTRRNK